MAMLEIKYSVGDIVFSADVKITSKPITCPDCLGTGKCVVVLATQEKIDVDCLICNRERWQNDVGMFAYNIFTPNVEKLTIGQVSFENNQGRYMCVETGIGSGSVYNEIDLYDTEDKALEKAKLKTERKLKECAKRQFPKKYDFADSLSLIGFERRKALLENIKMKDWLELINNN